MMTTEWLEINQGSAPVLMSLPHTGTQIPDSIQSQLACSTEQALTDTDWYVHQLYDFVSSMGISTVRTAISRCVVDGKIKGSANLKIGIRKTFNLQDATL